RRWPLKEPHGNNPTECSRSPLPLGLLRVRRLVPSPPKNRAREGPVGAGSCTWGARSATRCTEVFTPDAWYEQRANPSPTRGAPGTPADSHPWHTRCTALPESAGCDAERVSVHGRLRGT